MKNTEKPSVRDELATIEHQLSSMDAERETIERNAKAASAAIVARQNELRNIQAPLGRMLHDRAEILRRISNGNATKAAFEGELLELESAFDEIFSLGPSGGAVGAYLHILDIRPAPANAARGIQDAAAFVERRKVELGNIEARIQEYARSHNLEYMLQDELK